MDDIFGLETLNGGSQVVNVSSFPGVLFCLQLIPGSRPSSIGGEIPGNRSERHIIFHFRGGIRIIQIPQEPTWRPRKPAVSTDDTGEGGGLEADGKSCLTLWRDLRNNKSAVNIAIRSQGKFVMFSNYINRDLKSNKAVFLDSKLPFGDDILWCSYNSHTNNICMTWASPCPNNG